MINDKDIEDINKEAIKVLDIVNKLPYFEACMVLEIVRDTLRVEWMANVAKDGGFEN